MDVLHWIESGSFQIRNYAVVMLFVGHADVVRPREWFMVSLQELLHHIYMKHREAVVFVGALLPFVADTSSQVKEFLARNLLMQRRCEEELVSRLLYLCSGRVLLVRGGPVPDFYTNERLNDRGKRRLARAIMDDGQRALLSVHRGMLHRW